MKLKLFTACYPYGFGESFLNNELEVLTEQFDEITIFPFEAKGHIQPSYKYDHPVVVDNSRTEQSLTFSDKLFLLKALWSEFIHIKQKLFFLKKLRRFGAQMKAALKLSKSLTDVDFGSDEVLYSFWMNEWTLALAILRRRGRKLDFVFRVNGYDIHDDRHEGNYLPFRYFIYREATRVYPLSQTSQKQIQDLKIYPEKIDFSYFGTLDKGKLGPSNPDEFTVFTCASAIPLKRLVKIAHVISLLPFPTRWAHHGGGPTLEKVIAIMDEAPDHIKFQYTEKVEDYNEVYEIQRRVSPDVFINLSTSEGLPVTVMESLSFGVPQLLNDVGSCAEFINETTGVLVKDDATPEEIVKHLIRFKEENKATKDGPAIRKFWEENFSAEKNYVKFADKLKADFK